MMREIKFRAWCKNKNEWEQHVCFLSQHGSLYHGNGGPIYQMTKLKEDTHVVSMYTGLKDKNGVDVYEGDIVRTHPRPREYNPVREPCVVVINLSHGTLLKIYDKTCAYGIDDSTEVIGNIYENPELLEGNDANNPV